MPIPNLPNLEFVIAQMDSSSFENQGSESLESMKAFLLEISSLSRGRIPSFEPGSKLLVLGMAIPPLIGNPYNGYIDPGTFSGEYTDFVEKSQLESQAMFGSYFLTEAVFLEGSVGCLVAIICPNCWLMVRMVHSGKKHDGRNPHESPDALGKVKFFLMSINWFTCVGAVCFYNLSLAFGYVFCWVAIEVCDIDMNDIYKQSLKIY